MNCVIVLVFCLVFVNGKIVFNKSDLILQVLWLLIFVLSFTVSVLKGRVHYFNDLSDLLFFIFLIVSSVQPVYSLQKASSIIFWSLGIYTLVNSLIILITVNRFFDLSIYLAETSNFDLDYISIRSIGLNGQPGKLALFSALSIIIFSKVSDNLQLFTRNIWLPIFVILALINCLMSFSRIGIIITILSIGFVSRRLKFMLTFIMVLGSIYFVSYHPEKIKLLFRSDSVTKVDASSLENRLTLRREAFKIVFEDPINFLLGFGPSKSDADKIEIPIKHHSLRYPDSSITLSAFRYGIISLLISILFFTRRYLANIIVNREFKYNFFLCAVILISASLDPIFHDLKLLILLFFIGQLTQLSADNNVRKTSH